MGRSDVAGPASVQSRSSRPLVVFSGVNLVEGGTLTVFREIIRAATIHRPQWEVVALVNRTGLVGVPGVHEMAFEQVKRSWLRRLMFEWRELAPLCRELQADVWVSMHDITPILDAPRQFVYCHNPGPFSTLPALLAWQDPTFALFKAFYGRLYGLNIHRNSAVIVQQDWLREEFRRRFNTRRVIVAHPSGIPAKLKPKLDWKPPKRFLFPTMPRVFKNIELLADALALLEADQRWGGELSLTIDGSEGRYARRLVSKFRNLRSVRFLGRQSHEQMDACYAEHDALVFPSLLETWGLPLTEARDRGLPILAADLPYAHETIGNCEAVRFFDPHDAPALCRLMLDLHLGNELFSPHRVTSPAAPFADGWPALVEQLLDDESQSRQAAVDQGRRERAMMVGVRM